MKTNNAIARPFRAALSVALLWALCAPFAAAQLDAGTLVRLTAPGATVTATAKSYNRVTKESLYEITLTNSSGGSLRGPVYVVIEGLTGAGVTVKNASGTTSTGAAYYIVSAADLANGAVMKQNAILGNPGNVRITFNAVGYATPAPPTPTNLKVEITSPGTLITVGSTPLLVKGTINDPAAVLTLNGVPISHGGGTFQANVALIEGHNSIIARAVNATPQESTATISVSLDLTPPYVTIEAPTNNAVVTTGVITVSGLINDIVRGTVSDGQANVTVNGRAAVVANRSYLAEDVPLVEGENTILVQASDQVGNTGSAQIKVIYEVPTTQFVGLVSGQGQEAQIRETLPQSLRVKLQNTSGQGIANKPVVFRVVQGDGAVGVGGSDEGPAVLVNSGANGEAATTFKLGSRAGSGNHRVSAKAVGFEGEVIFVASATTKPGDKVTVNSGNNQRGAANQPLPLPFVIVVVDDGANVIEDAEIEFKVTSGTGQFQNGAATIRALTDSDGRASAKLTLGPEVGLDVHRVTATLVGTPLYAGFTASALQSGDPGQTAISGVVLDNQDHPLPNVTMRVEGTTREARTNAQGQFKITEVPVGPVHLIADGSTTTVPGEWPTLPYNIVTVAGADNPLPVPVYLVKLDTVNAVTVGAVDKELTLPEVPGFKLTVKANSVTFPNGDRVGQLSVTPVNVSKIPMAPPNGMQPQFIVTIQPAGARFDPPAALQLPNVDGHPPGAQVEMYSFDHDLEEFVAIGVGTVSADGTVITSNPGVGVIKAGWHCGSQPTGGGCAHNCPVCQDCDGACNCVAAPNDPRLPECQKCTGGTAGPDPAKEDQCCGGGICKTGSCNPVTLTAVVAKANGKDEEILAFQTGGTSVNFTSTVTSSNCELEYDWAFGDGGTSTDANPSHTYANPGEYEVKVTVKCKKCGPGSQTDTAKVILAQVELVTPKGDPVASPKASGDGQNEFVFDTASPGVLTVNFKAKVLPAGLDPNKIKDKVTFTIGNIGATAVTWAAANPGGKASVSGSDLVATATFSGLPASNGDFGSKATSLQFDGSTIETVNIEVFFDRDATNHPGGAAGSKNWFHYWNQTAAGDPDLVYAPGANFGETPKMLNWSTYAGPTDRIDVSDQVTGSDTRRDGSGQTVTGIDLFANTVAHENQHVAQVHSNNGLAFFTGVTGALSNAAATGWSFNIADTNAKWNHFTDTDGSGGFNAGDADLDANRNDFGESIEIPAASLGVCSMSGTVPLMLECDAELKETIAEDTHKAVDWGSPGKQHLTGAHND